MDRCFPLLKNDVLDNLRDHVLASNPGLCEDAWFSEAMRLIEIAAVFGIEFNIGNTQSFLDTLDRLDKEVQKQMIQCAIYMANL